jgi:signal transduction histidine kinase
MGIMAISISLIISPKQTFIIFNMTYLVLVVGTVLTQNNPALIESSILNGLVLVVLGLIISKMIFSFHVKDFIKSKTIQEKTAELENSQIALEYALIKRTEELACANEQLVQEIHARHAMEVQLLKGDLEYQKKLTALNEAMEYERIRGEFFANISHELRTPLNIIFCTLQMLNSSLSDDRTDKNRMSKYMRLMKQNCYRLLRLINNIIDITKIDSGYMNMNLSNQDIVQIVENITLSVIPYAEYNGFEVTFDTEMEEKMIACDPDKIERIILNLLSNAFKFSAPRGSIYVNMQQMNDYVIISVKDTGIGIPKEKQKVIFDRFIQVDKSMSRGKEGSGIGLSLAKSFVEMHNGKISIISELNKGSEFIIELPDVTVESSKDAVEYSSTRKMSNTEVINIEFSDIYTMENIHE